MSLTHALLGLLATAPASGYELTKQFEGDLGRYAWQAGHTSIYPELGKLAARGLVTVTHEGARGARTYDVTTAGREELRTWLFTPGGGGAVRNEQVLRMFLLSALDNEDQHRLLARISERCATDAVELRALIETDPWDDGPRGGFGRLAAEFGVRQYDAVHGWAIWAQQQLPVTAGTEPAGPD